MKPLAILLAGFICAPAAMANAMVADLEKRLATDGIDKTNIYLIAQASSALVSLNLDTSHCDLQAVSLSVRLARGSASKAVTAHAEALRYAVGRCTGFVLALLPPKEVPKVCASIGSWTLTQTARELRRRIKAIDADALLASTPQGKACRDAYSYELNNTRVGLRMNPRADSPSHSSTKPATR